MFMYDDQSETNEVDVIRIRNVHKEDGNTMVSKISCIMECILMCNVEIKNVFYN